MASSTWLGARPSLLQTSAYSSRVRPRATASSTEGRVSADALTEHRFEEVQAVCRAGQCVDRVLWVGHQADDVAGLVAHARDVVLGAVRVLAGRVAEDDLRRVEVRREVAARRVLDRGRQRFA